MLLKNIPSLLGSNRGYSYFEIMQRIVEHVFGIAKVMKYFKVLIFFFVRKKISSKKQQHRKYDAVVYNYLFFVLIFQRT